MLLVIPRSHVSDVNATPPSALDAQETTLENSRPDIVEATLEQKHNPSPTHVCSTIPTHDAAMTDHTTIPDPPPRRSTSSPGIGPASHRASFAENLRHSPRSQRHPSFTQAAVQELLQHPPVSTPSDPRFAGRDWRSIQVGELVRQSDVRWTELGSSVEEATHVCIPRLSVALYVG